ncbi:hypothetical protein OC845_006206, partial [Tilletia horrida]
FHARWDSKQPLSEQALGQQIQESNRKYAETFSNFHKKKGYPHSRRFQTEEVYNKREPSAQGLTYEALSVGWTGVIDLGSQTVVVEFDTVSPSKAAVRRNSGTRNVRLWKSSADCLIEPDAYDPGLSGVAVDMHFQFDARTPEGDNFVGRLFLDDMEFAGLGLKEIAVGRAATRFLEPTRAPAEGICGLASQEISVLDQAGFFYALLFDNMLDAPIFAFALSRSGYSELSIGGTNPTLFRDLSFVHLDAEEGFFFIEGSFMLPRQLLPFEFL